MNEKQKDLVTAGRNQELDRYPVSDTLLIFLVFLVFEAILYLFFREGIPLLFRFFLMVCYVIVILAWTLKYRGWARADLGLVNLLDERTYWTGVRIGFFLAFVLVGIDTNTVYLLFHEAKLTDHNFVLLIVLLPMVTLLAPMEELIYRGFFFTILKKRLGPFPAIVLSSAGFAFAHSVAGVANESIYSIPAVAYAQKFVGGAVFAYFFHQTKSLAGPISAHVVFNWCAIIVYSLVYLTEPSA